MPEVDLGNVMGPQGVPGSQWYYGTKITGTSTTGTVFSSSGISNARVNDKYLNTSTGNIYNCTTAGAASVAKWAYIGNIKGPQGNVGPAGPTGEVDFTTPITFSVPSSRSNLASGDSIATLFGKTQKWFNDINSGGASTLLAKNLSTNRALISNSSGKIAVSTITSTELGYLDGVTSNIQGQIGTLSSLDTSAKGSLVAAVNELNGKMNNLFITRKISLSGIVVPANGVKYQWETFPSVDGYVATDFFVTTGSPHIMCSYNDGSLAEHGVTVVLRNFSSSPITTGESAILHVILCRTGFVSLSQTNITL